MNGNKIQFLCVFSFEIKPQFIATIIMALKSKKLFSIFCMFMDLRFYYPTYIECVLIEFIAFSSGWTPSPEYIRIKRDENGNFPVSFPFRIENCSFEATNKFHSISNQIKAGKGHSRHSYVEYKVIKKLILCIPTM